MDIKSSTRILSLNILDDCCLPPAGAESHVILWNVKKKLVMSSFRRLEAGAKLCILQTGQRQEKQVNFDFNFDFALAYTYVHM
jgi:hypothetical protein